MSQKSLSAFGLVALLALGCGPQSLASRRGGSTKRPTANNCGRVPEPRIVDLTQTLDAQAPLAAGDVALSQTQLTDYEQGSRRHKLSMGQSTGTHLDAPSHFVEGKRSVEQIPNYELVVPVVVMDVRDKARADSDYEISANDILDWEAIHGLVPVGAVFIANTGWHLRYSDAAKYMNQDPQQTMHFPGFGKAAAQLLVERDVVGVGIDTLSIDRGIATEYAAHQAILGGNKYVIENLAALDELPEIGATIVVAVLPLAEGTQAPARVLAMVPEAKPKGMFDEDQPSQKIADRQSRLRRQRSLRRRRSRPQSSQSKIPQPGFRWRSLRR